MIAYQAGGFVNIRKAVFYISFPVFPVHRHQTYASQNFDLIPQFIECGSFTKRNIYYFMLIDAFCQ